MARLSDALTLTPDGDALTATLTAEWAQGRTAFGGLVAALAVRATARLLPADRRLRSALVDFVGPAQVGVVRVEARVLRAGRTLTHTEARVTQGGEVCAVLLLAWAADRSTGIRVDGAPPPTVPAPDDLPAFPYLPGITPAFTQQYAYRYTGDALPFTGAATAALGGWCRLREPEPVDEAVLLTLLDAWPAPVLPLARGPAPASTVTWMVDFVGAATAPADEWWRFEADTDAASAGHASVRGRLWSADGTLVAIGRQLVAEFSAP